MTPIARRRLLASGAGLLLAGLAGCAGGRPPPARLEPLAPSIAGRRVWSQRLSGVGFPLALGAREGLFFAAGDDGAVVVLRASDGQELWRARAGGALSAGVGTDGRHVAVVRRDHVLAVFDRGQPAWQSQLSGQVLTAPLVAGERVFVLGVDRSVSAFDALDGQLLWRLKRPGDPLSLSQAGVLAPHGNTLLAGQGPRLAAIDPLRGTVLWEVSVSSPRGTNEVERLADLVGPAVRLGPAVCLRSFQTAVGCVDVARASLRWSRNVTGSQAIAADDELLVAGDATDRLSAWQQGSGQLLWSSDRFVFRSLSGLLLSGRTLIFGDFEGMVHFLDRQTGQALLRLPTDGSPVIGVPVAADATVLVATRAGGLHAFRPE
jgi:outer membrane protein assembly factor BamB